MSLRTVFVLVLALVFGGAAAMGVNQLRSPVMAAPAPETVPVVTAVVDVRRGMTLREDMLSIQQWPKEVELPPGSLHQVAEVVGRSVLAPLTKGEVVLANKLSGRGTGGANLASLIGPGMLALTIQTPSISSSVAGFILPGDRVDVLLTVKGGAGNNLTVPLLQNVKVLSVQQHLDVPNDNRFNLNEAQSVTLEVSLADASKLEQAQSMGTLKIALRNPNDSTTSSPDFRGVSDRDILPQPRKSWDERAKGILGTLKGLMPEPAPKEKVVVEKPPGFRMDIRNGKLQERHFFGPEDDLFAVPEDMEGDVRGPAPKESRKPARPRDKDAPSLGRTDSKKK